MLKSDSILNNALMGVINEEKFVMQLSSKYFSWLNNSLLFSVVHRLVSPSWLLLLLLIWDRSMIDWLIDFNDTLNHLGLFWA